ncbi:MAG: NADH-quinone oxidoreductase subunit L [Candidatus Rokubacteria bacterium]|nr:NADH-quinone oxidoreductase subunit L [Candidatus Rokubacteria bacterium]
MTETELALVIVGAPFLAAFALGCCPPLRRAGRAAAVVSLLGAGVALVAAVQLVTGLWWVVARTQAFRVGPSRETMLTIAWLPQAGAAPLATVGVLVDPLAAAMATLVALVAFLVQLYSVGYLAGETPGALGRYYLYQSLFAFAMLGLVFAPNFLQMFVFWELVGLCSYLLIGFWYERPAAARAAVKAFWVTKLGDVGFLVGIVLLWGATGLFGFLPLFRAVGQGAVEPGTLALCMALIYLGAVGKSAQFPLHVWLPDAMEGPTPVSALIHAATMVAAGVYLVARTYPLFVAAPGVLVVVAWVGAFTALLAATLALVQTDIKRVLAYSTVSQLGYMMAALGAGTFGGQLAGFFHLLTHGFFKALLFLAAGAVIHAVATNDMREMGGLGRAMPKTAIVFVVGALALAGVPPLSGFFSKEAVLAAVWEAELRGPFAMLAVTVALTAFYMGRAAVLTFWGPRRAGGHAHDPPPVMAGPLWVLAVGAAAAGVLGGDTLRLNLPQFVAEHVDAALPHGPRWLAWLSLTLAAGGLVAAWAVYQRQAVSAAALRGALGPLGRAAEQGYGLDAAYAALYRGILLAGAWLIGWIDRYLVDGLVNVASAWTLRAGRQLRGMQTGRAQDYLYGVTAGLFLLLLIWAWP